MSASSADNGMYHSSKKIDKLLNEAYVMESEKVKLLLLGAGESGKSTIFKQMRVLFGAPLAEEEKNQITPIVYSNTISSMKVLLQAVIDMDFENKVRNQYIPNYFLSQSMLTFIINRHCHKI